MGSLVVRRRHATASELAARSHAWRTERAAVLTVGAPQDDALVIGGFQRRSDAAAGDLLVVRRGSGGGVVRVGQGSVWIQLALPRVDALVPCTADKLLNRYVRPLLRGVTRASSVPTNYFGRDWISAAGRPVGFVGFAHDAASNAALVEAVVAVASPFAAPGHPSFLGKSPATIEEVSRRNVEVGRVVDAIVEAYAAMGDVAVEENAPSTFAEAEISDAPWIATRQEAIGTIACGRDESGTLRIGGELMASADAVNRLEERLAALPSTAAPEDVGRIVDDALTTGGAVTFGVRSLASIRDVVLEALGTER